MRKVAVGAVRIVSLCDQVQGYAPGRTYPEAGDALARFQDRLTADGLLPLNFGCFLVVADGRRVLVDTGLGPSSDGRLMSELEAAAVEPSDIDAVFFTHLHGDHTGWNVDAATGRARFPKARYLVPKGDFDHYRSQDRVPGSFTRDVLPLYEQGQVDLIEGEHAVSESLTTMPTPGHTPGHTSLLVASQGERALILGDVLISTIDAEEPAWKSSFDFDHDLARKTRLAVLDSAEADGRLIAASHLPDPGFGRIARLEGRRFWQAI